MRLGRFELLKQIGAGRDGVCYLARGEGEDVTCDVVDLSTARNDARRWEWLAPRLRLSVRLEHPALIRVRELSLEAEAPFIALQQRGDICLVQHVRERGRPSSEQALRMVQALAEGLAIAHGLGLVHGRIAPDTVWMDATGHTQLDITGAEFRQAVEAPFAGTMTQLCLAPEVKAGSVPDRLSDIYSLGALLAWLLGSTGSIFPAYKESHPEPEGARIKRNLLRDVLESSPDERPSAREFATRLAGYLRSQNEATGEWRQGGDETLVMNDRASSLGSSGNQMLGRFRLLNLLGVGGQGAVYRAEDTATGSIVALKILRADGAARQAVLRRFRKEARLMAEANNPWVVNLLEFNEEEGTPYLVLEFVDGRNLQDLLAARGRLDEPTALEIMADVARALAGPHDRGIIHRDVKPANVLLLEERERDGEAAPLNATVAMAEPIGESPGRTLPDPLPGTFRVKLSDFGLARHLVDTQSLAMTEAGALLGTPHYMAPEQWNGLATDPRTDVYAMGATLFQLLAGQPPFSAETRDELLALHCNAPVPPLRRFQADISEGTIRVVEKALAKRADDRYHDAAAMLSDLEALRHGEPSAILLHPQIPDRSSRDVISFDWEWDLRASPRALWPLVSNTERINRALGLPAPEFTTRTSSHGAVERHASFHKVVPFAWKEHPFEWIEGQRFGVLREFQQGVFSWFLSLVELQPRGDGGTRLIQRIRVSPRGLGGRLMAHFQLARGGRRSLERVYRRIDAALTGELGQAGLADPFEEPAKLSDAQRSRLDQALERLVQAGADPAVIDRLGEYLEQAPEPELARIRPLALASRLGLDSGGLVTACLQGANAGLLVLLWDLLCPVCRISSEIKDTLRALGDHGHCPACNLDYPLDFASSVEMVFRIHPEIRQVDLGTYCIGGPAHSPHVLAQVRVAPGERLELPLAMANGSYRMRGPQLPWSADFQVDPTASVRLWEIPLATGPEGDSPRTFRPGHQVFTLENSLDHELLVRIERTAARSDALTAAQAASMALFRELFPGEVLSPGQLATISTVTLLVAELDPDQADALYREQGDSRSFAVIQDLLGRLQEAVRDCGGAVVKTIGEGLLAVFPEPASAVRAGLDFPGRLASGTLTRELRLRTAIHRGTALAANVNDQLDYFGTTARQVLRMPAHVEPGELALAPSVAADPEVVALLHGRTLEPSPLPAEIAGMPFMIKVRL